MSELASTLEKVKLFAMEIIANYPDKLVYHNIKFAERYVKQLDMICDVTNISTEDIELAEIGAWLIAASYEKAKFDFKKDKKPTTNIAGEVKKTSNKFFEINPIDKKLQEKLENSFDNLFYPAIPKTNLEMLLADALTAEMMMGNPKKNLKKIYEEMLLNDVTISKKKWIDITTEIISNMSFYLPYCKENLEPKVKQLLIDLEKDRKLIQKTSDLALKRELEISDIELKQLKKNLNNSKGRDDRGIQTMFRITSRNHYTLNAMVDKKASIMITVNSIILSLVISGLLGEANAHGHFHFTVQSIPIFILTLTSVSSIIFAILSITPGSTHGEFTEDEIRNKEGNLLYYGNFHNMKLRDYEWAVLQMMNDQDFLYGSMIKDLYFLGQLLSKKYKYIRLSLTIFLIGLVLTVLVFFLGRFVY